MHNRQSVRLISDDIWQKIKKIYPKALTHSFEFKKNNATGNCVQCHLEAEDGRLFLQKLKEWKSKVLQPPLSELLQRRKQCTNFYPSKIDLLLQNEAKESIHLRALSRSDLQRWRDFFYVAEKASKKSNDVIKKQLNDLFSGGEWKFQSFICNEHQMTVGIPSVSEHEDVTKWLEEVMKSNVELLLCEEYDKLLSSLISLESLLRSGNDSDALPLKAKPPTITIDPYERAFITTIVPQTCIHGCSLFVHGDNYIENGGMISNPAPNSARKTKTIYEVPGGPLCKVFVHEVENGTSIDVAASSIIVDASNRNTPLLTATGRPRRSRKSRGEEVGVYSVDEVEMALDGNVAHLRLLLYQYKGKKILGQKLFLLHTSAPEHDDAPLFTELSKEYDEKMMHEIVSLPNSNDGADKQEDCEIHLILSYDDDETSKLKKRTRLNKEDKDEEDDLVLSLSNISNGGWKSDDGNVVIGEKQSKRRKRERGFQGTFLQSTEIDERDNHKNTHIENSSNTLQRDNSEDDIYIDTAQEDKHVSWANDDVMTLQSPEFDERDNHANTLIENSPNIPKRDNSKDIFYIDSIQEEQHVSRANDETKNTQLGLEEEITGTVMSGESHQNSAEPACEAETLHKAPKCRFVEVIVHEVENGTSIDVAASSIIVDASNRKTPLLTATGRPRRFIKSCGKGEGEFSTCQVEMALDGNVAHLRLLLCQYKGKKILGQKLFLLHTSAPVHDDTPLFTELSNEYDEKMMHEIVSLPNSNDGADKQEDCEIHLILSYDDDETSKLKKRTRLNKEDKDEEDDLVLSLSNISNGGWKSDDGNVVMGEKQSKRRKRERGFQGTFLQSTGIDERDNHKNTHIENSSNTLQRDNSEDDIYIDTAQEDKHVSRAINDVILSQPKVEEEITRAVKTLESNRKSTVPAYEAESRYAVPTFFQSTEFDERDTHKNNQIEDSPKILQRDESEDIVYFDSVQDDQQISRAHDDIKNTQLGVEEQIPRAVITLESNRNSAEATFEAEIKCEVPTFFRSTEFDERDNHDNIQIENNPNKLQQDCSEEADSDSSMDTIDDARAHNDIIDIKSGVEEEMTIAVNSSQSNHFDAKSANKSETTCQAPKIRSHKVIVHGAVRIVGNGEETSKSPKRNKF
ncbi:hypothetical protein ACHAXA_006767 [Cyclostephanos tholiformis]|uniref:Uncharacterized protein n=1 Tax=Cyclostephanos tholiformis TaxID=382380 RepID=A0ABD3SSL5_9STRA